jgi:hypothetical protein
MSRENPLWGAPKIHGELLKLGVDIGETSVSRYMVRFRRPPSQTWKTFFTNHLGRTVSIAFFTEPTIRFQILYVFSGVGTRAPPHRPLRRDGTSNCRVDCAASSGSVSVGERATLSAARPHCIFGKAFVDQVKAIGIKQVLSAPRSPWQRAYVERLIGTIRRECLDHMIVLNERCLCRHLKKLRCLLPSDPDPLGAGE